MEEFSEDKFITKIDFTEESMKSEVLGLFCEQSKKESGSPNRYIRIDAKPLYSPSEDDLDELEDEPEVEIHDITVQQELVEVALDPSLLLYVKKDNKSMSKEQNKTVTAILRKVKRKPGRSKVYNERNKEIKLEEDILRASSVSEDYNFYDLDLPCDNSDSESVRTKYEPINDSVKTNKVQCKSLNVGNIKQNQTRKCSRRLRKVRLKQREKEDNVTNEIKTASTEGTQLRSKTKTKSIVFDSVKLEYSNLMIENNKQEVENVPNYIKQEEITQKMKPDSYDCTVCSRKFKEKSHLATHSRAHIDVRNFKCNDCGGLFKTKTNLFFHMKTHSEAPFICVECNKEFAERKMLMRHIRVVHSSQNKHPCDQCGRVFKSVNNLHLHYTLHTGNKPYSCATCGKSFVYKSTYVAHTKAHMADDAFSCDLCPMNFENRTEIRRHCNHHSEVRPWLCTVCGKGYSLKGTLKNHMKTHEPEKPFKCMECPKSFVKKQSFECHIRIHAGESPQYMCDQCSQSYFNVFALKRHYLKHTSDRQFSCHVCHKAFWMKDALKVHMRTHSSTKQFACIHCPKTFAHKHTLDAHLRTHLQVQPYSCSICQKSFIHKYNLSRHERQHVTLGHPPPAMLNGSIPLLMLPTKPFDPCLTRSLHIL